MQIIKNRPERLKHATGCLAFSSMFQSY